MIPTIIGRKIEQSQKFLENGKRIPVTTIVVSGNVVTQQKSQEKDGYVAIQLGFGNKKRATKAVLGHVKKANLTAAPAVLKEVRVDSAEGIEIGSIITAAEVLKPGDIINVTGTSKGKGFAGGVKRHHFKGGPRTHGQSDRERAPGSIGQTTTPGRVYKGKRMAGRMGHEQVTIRNVKVVAVDGETVLVEGVVPGIRQSIVYLTRVGEMKKFVPLYQPEQVANVSKGSEAASASNAAEADVAETEVVKEEKK